MSTAADRAPDRKNEDPMSDCDGPRMRSTPYRSRESAVDVRARATRPELRCASAPGAGVREAHGRADVRDLGEQSRDHDVNPGRNPRRGTDDRQDIVALASEGADVAFRFHDGYAKQPSRRVVSCPHTTATRMSHPPNEKRGSTAKFSGARSSRCASEGSLNGPNPAQARSLYRQFNDDRMYPGNFDRGRRNHPAFPKPI
jgi:hypothetical protein